jgi:hypothetical protein
MLDPDLKRQWAKKHLDSLTAELAIYHELNSCRISTSDDTENGWYIVRAEVPRSDRVYHSALIVGDFVSCLRASLDHLIWQLALIRNASPSKKICFPICEEDVANTRRQIAHATEGIPPKALAIVKSMQPYNSGPAFKSTHLWRLHKLWNIDKHRQVAAHSVVTDWIIKNERGFTGKVVAEQLDHSAIMKIPLSLATWLGPLRRFVLAHPLGR